MYGNLPDTDNMEVRYRYGTISRDSGVTGKGENNQKSFWEVIMWWLRQNGHVRDLPKSQLGVDVENDYEPKYITIRGKGEILANLRKEVKKADKVYLATDPDREGEAISWHLSKALKLEDKKVYRISFNEITKNAVKASLKNRGISIWIWWMHSRRDVCWTVWLDTASVPSSGPK